MNKFVCFLIAVCFFSGLNAQQLAANFDYSTFNGPIPYLETYISVNASTIVFSKKDNGKYQGKISIILMITDNDGATKFFDKYELLSPEVIDSNQTNFHFIDQQRIALTEGDYTFNLNIVDANSGDEPYMHQEEISFWTAKETAFSSIQFVESYQKNNTNSNINKNGIDLKPMPSNVFHEDQNTLHFYTELYNLPEEFVFYYYITSVENNKIVGNLAKSKVQKPNNKTRVFIGSLPLEKLFSGSYLLVCEAKNNIGETVATQSKYFYRIKVSEEEFNFNIKGTFVDNYIPKQLKKYIDYIYPIQKNRESITAQSLLEGDDTELMKNFFYHFWKKRYPLDPFFAWNNYLKVVEKVNEEFDNGSIPGYKTDRGRIYLKYGAPNSRVINNFSSEYERFEVWHYYKIDHQSDCRFVFSGENRGTDMSLVLSNVDGELTDTEWLMRFGESLNQPNFDPQSPIDYFINPQ